MTEANTHHTHHTHHMHPHTPAVDDLLDSLERLRCFALEHAQFYASDEDQLRRIALLSADASFWHRVLSAYRQRLEACGG